MILRLAGLACFGLFLSGCAEEISEPMPVMSDDHDHDHDHGHGHGDDHPETVGAAMHELEELYDTVKTAFDKDDSDAAHGPLHAVGHLLDDLQKLVDASKLDAEAKQTVTTNVDTLMDSYGKVDSMMHGNDGAEYSEVSQDIDAAMKAIKEALGELAEHDGHHEDGDHPEDDHDGEEK